MRKKIQRKKLPLTITGTPAMLVVACFAATAGYFYGLEDQPPQPLPIASENPHIKLCFTPGTQCRYHILKTLEKAQKSIYVQSFSFTSKEIAAALIAAQSRGIKVQILADRSQLTDQYSQIPNLRSRGVSVAIDRVPGIAHNKVIIIDEEVVLTGSYNWTNAAEKRNAENLLFIRDPKVAARYLENFKSRLQLSTREA